jgi:hypothetical protein
MLAGIAAVISAVAALLAAYHAIRGNQKSTTIKASVNGNLERLVEILAHAAIEIPHDTATKVIEAPPITIPDEATSDERLALEWINKVRHG